MSSNKVVISKNFANRLKSVMEYLSLDKRKQGYFAKKIGVSPSYFSEVINLKSGPSFKLLFGIAKEFPGINVKWLLTGEGEMLVDENHVIVDEDPEIAELLEGARRVLKSGNPVAFDALERNIRYFDHAVATEKRLEALEEKLEVLMDVLRKKSEVSPNGEESIKKKAI